MVFAEIVLMLLVALLLAWLLAGPLGRPARAGSFWWFFLILFLGTWAIAAWIVPVGPAVWGVAWIPLLVPAILIALLILALTPRRPVSVELVEEPTRTEAEAIGAFFWLLLLGLALVIGISFTVA